MKINAGTIAVICSTALFAALNLTPAQAGPGTVQRGPVKEFPMPPDSTGPEGLAVGPDGNVWISTFGNTNDTNYQCPPEGGQLYEFRPNGKLVQQIAVTGSSCQLLGIGFVPSGPLQGKLLVIDFGNAKVFSVNPDGTSSEFMTVPTSPPPGLNALTFDAAGNVYVSDSFNGTIWKTGPGGGVATQWVTDTNDQMLLKTTGVPPFGANGLGFNKSGDTLFVANTGNDTIVKIPVSAGSAGKAEVFTNSINGADGLVLDACDNIWVAANQADEIVVVDPSGMVIAKLGDFGGVDKKGVPVGLLFPASLAFSADGNFLYVSNLALDLTKLTLPQSVDSQWASQVKTFTWARLKARIPPLAHLPPRPHCR
jgi:sugar lactone lactonase YvrE